jgi:hypothetical protein
MAKQLSPFEEAFKAARAKGEKTFPFNGKLYGTVTADEEQKRIDKMPARVADAPTEIQAGTRYVKQPRAPKARSLVDQGRGVQLYETADTDAVIGAGLGLASLYPGTIAARTAYGVARPAIGAAARYFSKKDSPAASVSDDIKEPSFNPEKMTGRDRPEPEFKKGGKVSSASSRGDGIAQRGKTKGRMC